MFLELRALKCWNETKNSYEKESVVSDGWFTPRKFNIDPEKWWLEDNPFLLKMANVQGRTVKLRWGKIRDTQCMVDLLTCTKYY